MKVFSQTIKVVSQTVKVLSRPMFKPASPTALQPSPRKTPDSARSATTHRWSHSWPNHRLLCKSHRWPSTYPRPKRHHIGQLHRFFFTVAEPGHTLAFNQRLTVRVLDVTQHTRRVADRRDRFAGLVKRLDQRDRVLIFGQIPQRAVAARIKHCVEIFSLHAA